jgi:hypothetical protein
MNIIELLDLASDRLRQSNQAYDERADIIARILRCEQVLPVRRANVNGYLHKLLGAVVVNAYENDTTIDISTRRAGAFHDKGYTTKLITWLDKMVKKGLLLSEHKTTVAKGRLQLGQLLTTYLDYTDRAV